MIPPKFTLQLLFFFILTNCFGQQVQLEGLDVRTVIIEDTATVHGYINERNLQSKKNHLKTKVQFIPWKKGKSKIRSRELYDLEGKVIYKVDYGWNKGRDSSTVFYDYDSVGRLIKAVRYNSIFGSDHKGRTIQIEYDSNNRVTQCKTEYDLIKFYYNSNGKKDRIEINKYHHYCFPSVKRPKRHVYDTTIRILYFSYDSNNLLKKVSNNSGHVLVKYDYEQNGQVIKKSESDAFITEYYYQDYNLVKSSKWEVQYPSLDSVLLETCNFTYADNKLSNCSCNTEKKDSDDGYSIRYYYNDKFLLIEKVNFDSKGIVYRRKNYRYVYY